MKNLLLNYGKNRIESVGKIIDYIDLVYINSKSFTVNHEKQTLTNTYNNVTTIINYVIDENEIHLYNLHMIDVNNNLLFSL